MTLKIKPQNAQDTSKSVVYSTTHNREGVTRR